MNIMFMLYRSGKLIRNILLMAFMVVLYTSEARAQDFHDPESLSWKFRYGASDSAFSRVWESYKDDGFIPIDIEMDNGGADYSGVWQKNTDGRQWASWRRLTSDQFHDRWNEYREKGFRPIDQDAEVIDGQLRYSLIMVENKEGLNWVSNRNLTNEQFSEKFEANKGKFKPIDIDAIEVRGRMLYSIIWVENTSNQDWVELRDMTPKNYGQNFEKYSEQGYRVSDLDCYERNGNLAYAAIWEKNQPGRGWVALRQMSSQDLRNNWHKYSDQGMRIVDIEKCPSINGRGTQYAAVWRENNTRYDWKGRTDAQKALSDFAGNANIPGVGAAIIRNGKVIFQSGAGFADKDKNITAHSGTIYRLASIAKPVTGTLAYDMEEAGIIDLDDRTDTIISDLGTQHDHTVRQLLQNLSCVKHYSDGDDNGTQVQYNSSQSALNSHLGGVIKTNTWISTDCSPGAFIYSTHGYTLAGAALEIEADATFADLIKTRIADPLGLDTLRVEVRSSPDSSGERATINAGSSKVSNTQFENVSWKAGGSGMESSARDLALFGDGVLRDRYFPRATRDIMWSGGTINGQANGWDLNSGPTQASKTGSNQGSNSHIRIDIANGITVVALTNTKNPSVNTKVLTQQLLDIARANP